MVEWISHRGLRRGCSENSQVAFDLALKAGFRWIETDLRCTADGQVVLAHDTSLLRIFSNDAVVEKSLLYEIELLRDPFHQKIVTFYEFAHQYEQASWVLDIKEESAQETLKALSKSPILSILRARIPERLKLLFWSVESERSFLSVFPGADTFARELQCWRAGVSAIVGVPQLGGITAGKTYALPPSIFGKSLYNDRIFSAYHRRSAKVLAYLPESAALCSAAIACGADYILANSDFFNNS